MPAGKSTALEVVVGAAAIAAPVLHTITDGMEWYAGGFSDAQLWLNYLAFAPMPWLLLGILFFPAVWVISWIFIRRSIALEEDEVAQAKAANQR